MPNFDIHSYMAEVSHSIRSLRERLRMGASDVLSERPDPRIRYTGTPFVESVGALVEYIDGNSEGTYDLTAVEMRDSSLRSVAASRLPLFSSIATQIPSGAVVLNVGAGGDVVPISAMQAAGHQIICTDFAQDVVSGLQTKVDVPVFSCDLIHLSNVLPSPVDYIFGNSTLAYIDPRKLMVAVKSIWDSMATGGIFTFDLAPNPIFFELAGDPCSDIVNPADPNPRTLLSYVRKHGVTDGINLMAWRHHYRALAVNLALVEILKQLFASHGAVCSTTSFGFPLPGGGTQDGLVLRVSKDGGSVLAPTKNESLYDDGLEYLACRTKTGHPKLVLMCIDRPIGAELSKALGLSASKRDAPWQVAEFIARHSYGGPLSQSLMREMMDDNDPHRIAASLLPYVCYGKEITRRYPPSLLAQDQVLHKQVFIGRMNRAQVDVMLDELYARQSANESLAKHRMTRKKNAKKQRRTRAKNRKR
jgi:hypothetical protein